jgi:sugar O-acyltransferase (sialic acid O-acetyltransferase NeuD family)
MKNLPVIILGAGGHSRVLIDTLLLDSTEILGMTDVNLERQPFLGVPLLGNDLIVERYSPEKIQLINGIGSVSQPYIRQKTFQKFKDLGFIFRNVIHPSSVIASDVSFGEGVQVMAGVVIQSGCTIGDNTIVNTSTSLDHECEIGTHVHLAPGVVLSGNVCVGELCHIGIGVKIVQSIRVDAGSLVKAGTIVTSNINSSA